MEHEQRGLQNNSNEQAKPDSTAVRHDKLLRNVDLFVYRVILKSKPQFFVITFGLFGV